LSLQGGCGSRRNEDGKTIADQPALKKRKHCSILANAAAPLTCQGSAAAV
jgi:hypothetical protein